jgi:hypothetical protein
MDLILTAARGLGWNEFRTYAASIAKIGFSGTKVVLVENITQEARNNLLSQGFQLVDFVTEDASRLFYTTRLGAAVSFLEKNYQNFRNIVWVDSRDLVFQSNPSTWMEDHLAPHTLLAAGEGIAIKDQPLNASWAKAAVPEEVYGWLQDCEVCCGGTLAGTSEVMYRVLEKVYSILRATPERLYDQAVLNHVLRESPFKEVMRIPSVHEGFAATCEVFLRGERKGPLPRLDPSGLVLTPEGTPFVIVHQYDRNSAWKSTVESRYEEQKRNIRRLRR